MRFSKMMTTVSTIQMIITTKMINKIIRFKIKNNTTNKIFINNKINFKIAMNKKHQIKIKENNKKNKSNEIISKKLLKLIKAQKN